MCVWIVVGLKCQTSRSSKHVQFLCQNRPKMILKIECRQIWRRGYSPVYPKAVTNSKKRFEQVPYNNSISQWTPQQEGLCSGATTRRWVPTVATRRGNTGKNCDVIRGLLASLFSSVAKHDEVIREWFGEFFWWTRIRQLCRMLWNALHSLHCL